MEDVGNFVAKLVDLPARPEESAVAGTRASYNEIIKIAERTTGEFRFPFVLLGSLTAISVGKKIDVTYISEF